MEDEVEVIEVVDLVSSESEAEAMEEDSDVDIDGDAANLIHPDQTWRFLIEGPPKGWRRPKAYTKLVRGRYFTNLVDTNKDDKARIRESVRTQLQQGYGITSFPLFEPYHRISAEFEFYRRLPNTSFERGKRTNPVKSYLSRFWNRADPKKPDLDNMVKLVKDSLEGVVYANDQQVVCYKASKMMDVEPPHEGRTLIWVRIFRATDIPGPEAAEVRDNAVHLNGRRMLTDV